MPIVQVQRSHAADAMLRRFTYRARQPRTTMRRSDWEFQTPRRTKKQQRTAAEIEAAKKSREATRTMVNDQLDDAVQKILAITKECYKVTQMYTEDWWHRAVLQRGHRRRRERKISDWNAWQYMVRVERAEGECFSVKV